MSRKVMIKVEDNDIGNFIERGIVRVEVARNAVLITESNDCVSRQAVMGLLNKRYCHKEPYERKEGNTVYKGYDTYYMINYDKLKALPSVLPKSEQGEWILVSEGLPKVDGSYRVVQKNGSIGTYVFHKDGNSEEYWKRCAVAWMPIPKYEG